MLLTFSVTLGLTSCVTHVVRTVDMTPPNQASKIIDESELLDVGVAIFDMNVPEDYDELVAKQIQPEIRRAEANYMPYFLKNLLQSTGNWGAVRVVPRQTHAVDVSVGGKILSSNGEALTIEAHAVDATGRVWFDKEYSTLASKYAYDDTIPANIDPFQAIYKDIANDMLAYQESLDSEDLLQIRAAAELKFARAFSPEAFSEHVEIQDDGSAVVLRLPAENDPMLARVRKIREREYLFIDTLDEYYGSFHRNMYTSYQNWRSSSYTQAIAYRELKAQAKARRIAGAAAIVGGIAATQSSQGINRVGGISSVIAGAAVLKSSISKTAEAQIHAEILQELGVSAEAEIIPHTISLENETVRLQGSVDKQYNELRRILRRLYYEDLGFEQEPDISTEGDNQEADTSNDA